MDEFMKLYTALSLRFPLSMTFKYMHTGIPRWRIEVFGKDMAVVGGGRCDMQVLHAENPDLNETWRLAAETLKKREPDLKL